MMRRYRRIAGAAVLWLAAVGGSAPSHGAPVPDDLGKRLSAGYVQPAMQRWSDATQVLHGALQGYCSAPAPVGAKAVHTAMRDAVGAWSSIAFLRFGPLVADNRFERIAFWPDPRNIVQRQLGSMLKAATAADLAPQALYGRSVAVQGLPALEWLLYGDGEVLAARPGATFAQGCALATAIAANLLRIGGDLVAEWRSDAEFGRQFSAPAAANNLYRTPQEVAAEALKAVSTGLQFARDVQLLPVLGQDLHTVRPKRAAFWRSDLTAYALASNVTAMRDFLIAADFRYGAGEAWIGQQTAAELARAAQSIGGVPQPFERAATTQEGYRLITLTALTLKNGKSLVDQDLAAYFGVTIGFNALDGD